MSSSSTSTSSSISHAQKRVNFLNALNPTEAAELYSWLVGFKRCVPGTAHIFQDRTDKMQYVRSLRGIRRITSPGQVNADVVTHPGQFWLEWATCLMVSSKAALVINRQQVDVPYTKRPASVRTELWEALFDGVVPARTGCDSTRTQSFMAHHIAYATHKSDGPLRICGAGSSVSHRCDGGECVRPSHLTFVQSHRDNMDRQRCSGLILVVRGNVIVKESSCIHDRDSDDTLHQDTCRHITIVQVDVPGLHIHLEPGWELYI